MRRLGEGSETPRDLQSTDPAASLSKEKLQSARDSLRTIIGVYQAGNLSKERLADFCGAVSKELGISEISEHLSEEKKAAIANLFQTKRDQGEYGGYEPVPERKPLSETERKPAPEKAERRPRSTKVAPLRAKIRPRSMDVAPGRDKTVDDLLQTMKQPGEPLDGISDADYRAFGRRLLRDKPDLSDKAVVAREYQSIKEYRQTIKIHRPTLKEIGKAKPFKDRGEIAGTGLKLVAPQKTAKATPVAARPKMVPTELMLAMLDKKRGGERTLDLLENGDDPTEIVPRDNYATDRAVEDLSARSDTLVRDLRNYDALRPDEKADTTKNPSPSDEFLNALTTVVDPHTQQIGGRNAITFSIGEDVEGGFDAICIWVEARPSKRARLLDRADGRGETPLTLCLHEMKETRDPARKARQESRFQRLLALGARVAHAPCPLLIAVDRNRPDLALTLLDRTGQESPSLLAELKKARNKRDKAECMQGLISTCEALATCCAKDDPAFAAARKEAAAQLRLFIPKLAEQCSAFDLAKIMGAKWFDGLPKDQQKELLARFAKRLPGDIESFLAASGSNPATLERCLSLLTLARDYESPAEDKGWKVLAKKIEGLPLRLKKMIDEKPLGKSITKPLRESITSLMETTKILVDLYQLAPKALQPRFSAAPVNLSHYVMARMTDGARETMLQMLDSEDRLAGLMGAARMTAQRVSDRLQASIALGNGDIFSFGRHLMVFDDAFLLLTLALSTGDPELIKALGDLWALLPYGSQRQISKNEEIIRLLKLQK